MESQGLSFPSIVTLSVGGTEYQTSMSVLQREPESLLASYFTGTNPIPQDAQGRFFIDRDGYLFRYILNYLRNMEVSIPKENTSLITELIKEAEFFRLDSLTQQLILLKKQSSSSFTCLLYTSDAADE